MTQSKKVLFFSLAVVAVSGVGYFVYKSGKTNVVDPVNEDVSVPVINIKPIQVSQTVASKRTIS